MVRKIEIGIFKLAIWWSLYMEARPALVLHDSIRWRCALDSAKEMRKYIVTKYNLKKI